MSLKNFEPQRLYRQIASQIASLIESGKFAIGERLPAERDLSAMLSVSRSSIREAIISLEIEKIVEVRSGSGVYVVSKGPREIKLGTTQAPLGPFDVIRARAQLEAQIAVLAVQNASEEHLLRIRESLEVMRQCVMGEPHLITADRNFHLSIAEATGNVAYVLLMDTLWEHRTTPLYCQLENHFHSNAIWKKSMMEHEEIYAALDSRDSLRAANAMRAHMCAAEEKLGSTFE